QHVPLVVARREVGQRQIHWAGAQCCVWQWHRVALLSAVGAFVLPKWPTAEGHCRGAIPDQTRNKRPLICGRSDQDEQLQQVSQVVHEADMTFATTSLSSRRLSSRNSEISSESMFRPEMSIDI